MAVLLRPQPLLPRLLMLPWPLLRIRPHLFHHLLRRRTLLPLIWRLMAVVLGI
jgi:hypothetical protein